jgi:hypothetical protein
MGIKIHRTLVDFQKYKLSDKMRLNKLFDKNMFFSYSNKKKPDIFNHFCQVHFSET